MQTIDAEKVKKWLAEIKENVEKIQALCMDTNKTPFNDAMKLIGEYLANINRLCEKILE